MQFLVSETPFLVTYTYTYALFPRLDKVFILYGGSFPQVNIVSRD